MTQRMPVVQLTWLRKITLQLSGASFDLGPGWLMLPRADDESWMVSISGLGADQAAELAVSGNTPIGFKAYGGRAQPLCGSVRVASVEMPGGKVKLRGIGLLQPNRESTLGQAEQSE